MVDITTGKTISWFLWALKPIAIVYMICTAIILFGWYRNNDYIMPIGFLSIMHWAAIALAYFGLKHKNITMTLLLFIDAAVWAVIIVVYLILYLFIIHSDFRSNVLHHVLLFAYFVCDVVVAIAAWLKWRKLNNEMTTRLAQAQSGSDYQPTTEKEIAEAVQKSERQKSGEKDGDVVIDVGGAK